MIPQIMEILHLYSSSAQPFSSLLAVEKIIEEMEPLQNHNEGQSLNYSTSQLKDIEKIPIDEESFKL